MPITVRALVATASARTDAGMASGRREVMRCSNIECWELVAHVDPSVIATCLMVNLDAGSLSNHKA